MATFNPGYYLNPSYLEELADRYQNVYRQAKPFPHIILDNFLPAEVLEQVLDELSTIDYFDRQQLSAIARGEVTCSQAQPGISEKPHSLYLPSQTALQLDSFTHRLLDQLNSAVFINFLEQLTGSNGLLADPRIDSSLYALQQSQSSKLPLAANPYARCLDRKLTFLIYLNKNWKEEYGGHLELWNAETTRCEKKILPSFNRCIVFSTTDFSYYGHPEPLNCPDYETRKSLALYYYGKERSAKAPRSFYRSPISTSVRKEA